jgi:dienelactone hydrolase
VIEFFARPLAGVVLAISFVAGAQPYAPGKAVVLPGAEIADWGRVEKVDGHFGRPSANTSKVPAVLILHGSGGIDGRGAYYAKALQDAGIATLEITMFAPGGRPRSGTKATMPFAASGLKWLAAQSEVDGAHLGVMGLSWGGVMTLLMSSELTQNVLGKDVPKPIAFAALYPTCSVIARVVKNRQSVFYGAETRMSDSPMLIQVGTKDDYEDDEHACDALVASWPAASRERTTVRYYEGATHGFDTQDRPRQFNDEFAHGGRGGIVRMWPTPNDAAEARNAVVTFFAEHLKP